MFFMKAKTLLMKNLGKRGNNLALQRQRRFGNKYAAGGNIW